LTDPGTLKAFLGRYDIAASKGLGQHFLVSRSVVNKIIESLSGCEGVLEIGPGPGVLTGPISRSASHMVALEIDTRMIGALKESAPDADVRQLDALKASLPDILAELPEPRAIVSNLPYYITGPLLTRIADARSGISKAVLMMQKEVGERVLAGPKTAMRGSLSVFLQSQFAISKIAVAPAGAFLPPPKVDSVVLEFVPLPVSPTEWFFKLVRVGFTQPRKTLVNNLLGLEFDRETILAALETTGLTEKARPQELTLDAWVRLSEALTPPKS
jgi:16S rRNA (adenine1518-N6/adenine1519-N6)-dimethyltransferase